MRIKKGDKVVVTTGKDKGKEGIVLAVDKEKNRVVVKGVAMIKKHLKPGKDREFQQGGITEVESAIHASNVMYLHKGKPTRIGIKIDRKGDKPVKYRYAISTGDKID